MVFDSVSDHQDSFVGNVCFHSLWLLLCCCGDDDHTSCLGGSHDQTLQEIPFPLHQTGRYLSADDGPVVQLTDVHHDIQLKGREKLGLFSDSERDFRLPASPLHPCLALQEGVGKPTFEHSSTLVALRGNFAEKSVLLKE